MTKYKITGEIEAENEEEARFKATVEGGNNILEFKGIDIDKDIILNKIKDFLYEHSDFEIKDIEDLKN